MADMKAKLLSGLGIALLLLLVWWHVDGLKRERNDALQKVGVLAVKVEMQDATILELRQDKGQIDELMKEWRLTRETIDADRQEKRDATKQARTSDPSFSGWADADLPDSVRSGGLLGKKGNNHGATAGVDNSPGRVDGANAGSSLARQNKP